MKAYRYKLEAYWSGRGELLLPEAARLANFLSDVTAIDEASPAWFIAKGEQLIPLDPTNQVEQLAGALSTQRKAWVYGSRGFSGHDVLVTNARVRPNSVTVNLSCTIESSDIGVWFPSSLVVDVFAPRSGLSRRDQVDELLEAACRQMDPEWACLGAPDFPVQDLEERLTGVPKASFLTYLTARYPLPRVLPTSATIRPVKGARGNYIAAKQSWLDARDNGDQTLVESVEAALRDAGAVLPATAPVPE